jgi:predicted permease
VTDDLSRDVAEELEAHIQIRIDENLARGMSIAEARREAEQRFGPMRPPLEASTRIRRRQQRWYRTGRIDLAQAWRSVRRSPRLTALGVAVAVIGLTTALAASVVADALTLRGPAGVPRAGELWSVLESVDGTHPTLMSYEAVQALERLAGDLQPFAWGVRDVQVVRDEFAQAMPAELVSGSYFSSLRTTVRAGRLITAEDVAQTSRVVVLGADLARRMTSNPSTLVGQSLALNNQRFQIIGVAGGGFRGVASADPVEIWLPVTVEPAISTPRVRPDGVTVRGVLSMPGTGWMRAGVRKPASLGRHALADRLGHAVAQSTAPFQHRKKGVIVGERPWVSPFGGERERLSAVLRPLAAAVLTTLALTSACLGSLFISRVASRRRELVLRLALGSGRARLVRLVAAESILVVFVGGLAAVPMVYGLLAVAGDLQLAPGISISDVAHTLDGRALGIFAVSTIATALVAAVPPVLAAVRFTAAPIVGDARVVWTGNAFRRVLMAAQAAAGCMLIAAAMLLTRSIDALLERPIGYDADNVAFAEISPAGSGLSEAETSALVDRVLATGSGIAVADEPPHSGQNTLFMLGVDGRRPDAVVTPVTRIAGPFFDVLGVRPMAGRLFQPGDSSRRVAIVSAPYAAWWWPPKLPAGAGSEGASGAVGRVIRIGDRGPDYEIVGVVPGFRDLGFRGEPVSRVYLPLDQQTESLTLIARRRALAKGADGLVDIARGQDARLVPVRSGTMAQVARRTIEQRLVFRSITAIVGAGSMLMILVGVWGLAHDSLERRRREFGVRQALGASRFDVVRLAARDARFVAVAGGACGLAGAWQFGRILESWLFGVNPYDPTSLATAVTLVTFAAFGGAASPARQAARMDGAALLRED